MALKWLQTGAILAICCVMSVYGQGETGTESAFIITSRPFRGVEEYKQFTAITTPIAEITNASLSGPGFDLNDPVLTALSCDTDFVKKELYYYDYNDRIIGLFENFNLDMDLSKMNKSVFQASVGEDWVSVAVDWVSHNVYWTDGMLGQIFMKKGGKSNDNTAYYTVVSNLGRPKGLAVDPLAGYIFWTDTVQDTVVRASLVGEDLKVLLYPGQARVPSSIALDTTSKKLFWTDREHINSITYEGLLEESVFRYSHAQFYSIVFYKNVLITTDITNWFTSFIDPVTGKEVISKEGSAKEAHYGLCTYEKKPQPDSVPPDTCDNYGCQHICVIQPGNMEPTCLCHDGHTLKDKKMCEVSGYPYLRGIIVNTGNKLCIANINILSDHKDETPTCFYMAPANKTISWFDIDMKKRLVYFTIENIIYSAKVDQINQTAAKILEQNHDILGLTYDWMDDLLYYALDAIPETDTTPSIWRANPSNGATVISKPVTGRSPRALAVSPHDRKVFWVLESDLESSQVEYTDLSLQTGNITVLETTYGLDSVVHMYHSVDSETLYLLDDARYGKELVQLEYNGNYTKYPLGLDDDITDFAVYRSYILMAIHTEGEPDTLLASADVRFSSLATISDGKFLGLGRVMGIKVLDLDLLQPQYPNPCGKTKDVENGGCEQMCLPEGQKATCVCKMGFKLVDNTNCTSEPVKDNFILLTDSTYDAAFQISTANPTEVIGLKTPKLGNPTGILYDYQRETVLTTNDDFGDILSVYLNGTVDFTVDELFFNYPDRFAFDPHTNLIYYTALSWLADYYYDSYIGVFNTKGEASVIFEGAHYPRDIVIHPRKGWLFFTDHGDSPGIYRIDMDGSNYKEIVTKETEEIKLPNGLTIDYDGNRLFWTDGSFDTIKTINLDTFAVEQIMEDKGAHPMGLKYVDGHLYYSGWNNIQIKKFPVANHMNVTMFGPKRSIGGIMDIDVYMSAFTNADNVPENLGCSVNNGGCSDFCLPNSTGHTCGCTYYNSLLKDGRTCNNVPRCPSVLISASVNESDTCIRVEGNSCPFTCIENYRAKQGVSTITCTSEVDPDFDDELLWDNDDPCEEIFCPMDIANAQLNTSCDRTVGSDCVDYTCMDGYEKNTMITSLVCLVSGQWEMAGPLCIPKCPVLTSVTHNAVVHPSCKRDINEDCRLICDEGYKSTVSRITCLPGSRWNMTSSMACKEILCEDYFDGGNLSPGCSRKLQQSCSYKCDTGLQPTPQLGAVNITCMGNGVWSHGGTDKRISFCSVIPIKAESKANTTAIGVGVGGLVLILLILLLVFFLYRSGRLMGSKNKPPVSITSFDNPRYAEDGASGIPGSQNDRALAYAKLDEDRVEMPRTENVYDNPTALKP